LRTWYHFSSLKSKKVGREPCSNDRDVGWNGETDRSSGR